MPTVGEVYCNALLVRVVGLDFVAGMLVDPQTQRVVHAAPILRHLIGQHRDKVRQGFDRLGFRASIVKRGADAGE
jgi:hypothetical protein